MFKFQRRTIVKSVLSFMRDEGGATAIEYAMIASGIGVAVAGAIVALGSTVKGLFVSVSTAMK
jgi:pilus assembly protein Flp/PilA